MMAVRFKPCAVDGCNGNAHSDASGATGLCGAHYQRKRNHGSVYGGRVSPGDLILWIEAHVTHDQDECLLWPYCTQASGYGRIAYQGKQRGAHEVMCELAHGQKPSAAFEVAHGCGNPTCVNPRHLRWDTRSGNHADKKEHGTLRYGEKQPNSRLTEDQVIWMRRNFGRLTKAEMARQLGVSYMTASFAIRGRNWSHLNEKHPPPPGS